MSHHSSEPEISHAGGQTKLRGNCETGVLLQLLLMGYICAAKGCSNNTVRGEKRVFTNFLEFRR